jgi:hypothetical protein
MARAVEEWMHGRQVVVKCHGLYQRIVTLEFGLGGLEKSGKRIVARRPAIHATVRVNAKGHVVVAAAKLAGMAMIVVASGHQAAMNLADKIGSDGPVGSELPDPAVGAHGGVRLALRSRTQLLRRNVGPDCFVQFPLGKLCAFNPAGAGHFAL